MSWTRMGIVRESEASPDSSARRVTFATAIGRKRVELRTTA